MYKSVIVVASAVFCSVLAGLGILSAADKPQTARAAGVQPQPASSSPLGEGTAIPKGSDGHFWATASVNNKAVRFLVDTGATQVVLTPADAQRLGFPASDLVFDKKVITANGPSFAALVTLKSVEVGSSMVRDVNALVVQDGLEISLLGMSYLGRLRRFEATPSSLILHP